MNKKTTVLMILDGFGLNEQTEGNAIKQANTPVLDGLMEKYPCVKGYASGLDVGLPAGQMGNSEVGHLNPLRTVISSRIPTCCLQWSIVRKIAPHCICMVCFPMAVSIAIIPTCMHCCSWQRKMSWKRYMFMYSWTAETHPLHPVRIILHSCRKKCVRSA